MGDDLSESKPAEASSTVQMAFKVGTTAAGIVTVGRLLVEALGSTPPSISDIVFYVGAAGAGAVLGMWALALVAFAVMAVASKLNEFAENEDAVTAVNASGAACGAILSVAVSVPKEGTSELLMTRVAGVGVLLLVAYRIVSGRFPEL